MALTKASVGEAVEGVLGGLGTFKIYSITPDNSWLAAGEVLDLSADFSEIYWASFGGSKAINGYKMELIIPDDGTDVSASNVKVTAHRSAGSAAAMAAVPDTTDLSTTNANMRLLVCGKPADNT